MYWLLYSLPWIFWTRANWRCLMLSEVKIFLMKYIYYNILHWLQISFFSFFESRSSRILNLILKKRCRILTSLYIKINFTELVKMDLQFVKINIKLLIKSICFHMKNLFIARKSIKSSKNVIFLGVTKTKNNLFTYNLERMWCPMCMCF